jgi:hypothetical protein
MSEDTLSNYVAIFGGRRTACSFEEALSNYIAMLQFRYDSGITLEYPESAEGLHARVYKAGTSRKRFAKVTYAHPDGHGGSVHTFVEVATGDIFKAASYKAPAKHPRGNIYADDPLAGTTDHGGAYLR